MPWKEAQISHGKAQIRLNQPTQSSKQPTKISKKHKCHGKKLKSAATRVAYHHKVQGAMEKIHGGIELNNEKKPLLGKKKP